MTIKYVFSTDHYVMYSVAHDPLTLWDLINWWGRVNTDHCISDSNAYVQLIDLRNVQSMLVSDIEFGNFLTRVSERPQVLPVRTAVLVKRETIDEICRFWELPTFGLKQQMVAFTDLLTACNWLGVRDQNARGARALLEGNSVVLTRSS